jgi:hypothetical protein
LIMTRINKSKRSSQSKCKNERSPDLLTSELNLRMDLLASNLMMGDPKPCMVAKNNDLIHQKPN